MMQPKKKTQPKKIEARQNIQHHSNQAKNDYNIFSSIHSFQFYLYRVPQPIFTLKNYF